MYEKKIWPNIRLLCNPSKLNNSDSVNMGGVQEFLTNPQETLGQGITRHSFWVTLASLVAQTVKNPPAMQETRVQSLGQEDPLKKVMATHFSILDWRISRTEEPGGLQTIDLFTLANFMQVRWLSFKE